MADWSTRAFSGLLAVLLIGSLLTPIAAQPAAAQDSSDQICNSPARFFQTVNYPCTTAEQLGTVDETESGSYLQSDVHANARGVYESWRSTYVLTGNYLEDTPTIASLEGKNAIADSYENGDSRSVAADNVNQSVADYYSQLEIQLLEEFSAHNAQIAYLANQTKRDPDTSEQFMSVAAPTLEGNTKTVDSTSLNGEIENRTYELQNGTIREYQSARWNMTTDDGSNYVASINLSQYYPSSDEFYADIDYYDGSEWGQGQGRFPTNGFFMVSNVPDFNLSSAKIYESREVADRLHDIGTQRQTASDNFDPMFIDNMFSALDDGDLSTEDLRSAEGMVRYLSGDADVSSERYKIATHAVLDLSRADLNLTMTVSYDGATDFEMVDENGSRVRNYTDRVNATFKGLLFSGETPSNGFETGQSYDASALNGSQLIVTENETVHFYDGTFTIEEMHDADGNEVNQTDWEPGPNYETYSSDEYVQLLETISEQQEQISEHEDDSGWGLPNFGFGDSGGVIGLVVIGVVVLLVVGFVTDMLPGLGE